MDEWSTPEWAASPEVGALTSAAAGLGGSPTAGDLHAVEAALARPQTYAPLIRS